MKYLTRIIIITAVLVATFLFACDETATGPDGWLVFAHPDGAVWEYEPGPDDHIEVRSVLNGYAEHATMGQVQVLEEWHRLIGDTEWSHTWDFYLWISSDEVRIYTDLENERHITLLRFPLKVGNSWKYDTQYPDWDATVVAVEDVTVPGGTFNNCYKVEYFQDFGRIEVPYYRWFASGVGGKYGVKQESTPRAGSDLELRSYNLPAR